jgi:putative redox-active protein with C_GCAxxG_C_C motif
MRELPWPYKPIDPDVTAQRAFDAYHKHHCMYGAFEAMVAPVAEQLGAPYKDFPFEMFAYGAGGINGWATVCGALNGAAAALQIFSSKPEPLIDALFAWYESEPLPNFYPKGAKFPEVRSIGNVPLCHQSIAEWCKVSKKTAYSADRAERCGTITASVARKAVLLLNEQAAAKPVAVALPKETQACMSCHEKGGALENMRTKMNCGGCHAPLIGKHPLKKT